MSRTTCRGFSLVEVLVVIGVSSILIAMLFPALSGARDRARAVVCHANLKSTAVLTSTYLGQYAETYPFAAAGQQLPNGPDAPGGQSFVISTNHWSTNFNWPSIVSVLAPWREWYGTWVCPGAARAAGAPWAPPPGVSAYAGASYAYSTSFVARPSVWSDAPGPADAAELAAVRSSDLRSPDRKVMFFDAELAHARDPLRIHDRPRPLLFADAHVAEHSILAAASPVRNRSSGAARAWHDTPEGVHGADH